jgi:hypothetical protein
VDGGYVRSYRYQITVQGGLGQTYRQAFEEFAIEPDGIDTLLVGDLDQAALHGALNRIHSLGLELVELVRLADEGAA